jgi:hypothetical protein
MRNFLLLFAILFSVNVFACECGNWGKQFDSYSSSELVADVNAIPNKINNSCDRFKFFVTLTYGMFCYVVGLLTAYLIYLVH